MENNRPPGPPGNTANDRAAANIRAAMASQKRTARELADHLGISRQSAGRRIGGGADLTVNECASIARWLAVPISAIISDDR